MNRRKKSIIAFWLTAILLLPYTYQLEHNHDHAHTFNHQEEGSRQSFSENCFICNFQYSVFLSSENQFDSAAITWHDNFINLYKASNYTWIKGFSFMLRAPPVLQTA